MSGQVVIVTGASSGIGLACASRIVSGGGSVVMNARTESKLVAAASDLSSISESASERILTVPGDAANAATAEACVNAALDRWGHVDGLINNAGGSNGRVPLEDLDENSLLASAQRNLHTVIMMCKAAVRPMRAAGYGRIVNIASLAGRSGSIVGGLEYSADKAAVIGFTKALAAEVGPYGIVVNAVAPGLILTPRVAQLFDRLTLEEQAEISRSVPVGRHGRVDEVAAPALFLLSPGASFINGAVLDVNGGRYR